HAEGGALDRGQGILHDLCDVLGRVAKPGELGLRLLELDRAVEALGDRDAGRRADRGDSSPAEHLPGSLDQASREAAAVTLTAITAVLIRLLIDRLPFLADSRSQLISGRQNGQIAHAKLNSHAVSPPIGLKYKNHYTKKGGRAETSGPALLLIQRPAQQGVHLFQRNRLAAKLLCVLVHNTRPRNRL